MWNQLTPQQQQFLMRMLQMQSTPQFGAPQFRQLPDTVGSFQAMPAGAAQMAPGLALQTGQQAQPQPGTLQGQLGNPLMAGGNSALSPQQQAAMLQYQQLLGQPQGWGAGANGNVPVWQLLMGRGPWYGQGTGVP